MGNQIVKVPEILLPKSDVDLQKWAVIACDQFTSEPKYWENLEKFVGDAPSSLNVVFPEVYLGEDNSKRIKKINSKMKEYLDDGIISGIGKGFVLVERSTPYTKKRIGLVLAIDLEEYSYVARDKTPIKATEGTILSRIPPRVKIREHALIEMPHIMLLIDDVEKKVIEPIYERRESLIKLYDFDLNQNGGHITGYFVDNTDSVKYALNSLIDNDVLMKKYGTCEEFMFAVGDGNHSLATAKQCWENLKPTLTEEERNNHPQRYALCEVVNLQSEGITFEPIHRLIKNVDADKFVEGIKGRLSGEAEGKIITSKGETTIPLDLNAAEAVANVQNYIDEYINNNGGEVDYIHGTDALFEYTKAHSDSVAITLNKLNKDDLFKSVLKNGSLPRKTFSMGENVEKRYYLEARKITL